MNCRENNAVYNHFLRPIRTEPENAGGRQLDNTNI
jgi:hypothetical protein